MPGVPDLTDPRWFAVDLHVPDRRFGVLRVDDDLVDRTTFLDTRMAVPFAEALAVPVAAVPIAPPHARVAWLFHTSFCASTLLARALHVPPHTVCLKEPLVLRRLADARKSSWPLEGLIETTVHLLARPWHPGGAVVIKPTHVALNVAALLMTAAPHSRAVILTSSLDDFMISNLNKLPDTQAKIPELVKRALDASGFSARLSAEAMQPPDLICASGLQWAAQRELMWNILDEVGPSRVRALDATSLLADIGPTATACGEWLELPIPRATLAAHATAAATRNAKAITMPFSPSQRMREAEVVAGEHRAKLAGATAWLAAHVLPAMRSEARADPPAW